MTSTSVTTFFCFCICIVSPVWDFRCFGITCGFMILADFALVMTLLPASVIILETKINPWWRRTCKKVKAKNQTAEGGAPDEADSPQPRKLEVFFGGKFADFVLQYRKYIIAAHLVLTIVSITVPAAVLRMSNEEYTFAPPEHLLSRLESYPKKFQPEDRFWFHRLPRVYCSEWA